MGLLDGKNIVITGVLTDASLAFGVAELAQREGANIVLTGAGRALSRRVAALGADQFAAEPIERGINRPDFDGRTGSGVAQLT